MPYKSNVPRGLIHTIKINMKKTFFVCSDSDCLYISRSLNDAINYVKDTQKYSPSIGVMHIYWNDQAPLQVHCCDGHVFID